MSTVTVVSTFLGILFKELFKSSPFDLASIMLLALWRNALSEVNPKSLILILPLSISALIWAIASSVVISPFCTEPAYSLIDCIILFTPTTQLACVSSILFSICLLYPTISPACIPVSSACVLANAIICPVASSTSTTKLSQDWVWVLYTW